MQRGFDWLLGLSLLFWGVAAVVGRDATSLRSPVVFSVVALNGLVAWLFIRREMPRCRTDLTIQAAAVPSVLIGPIVLKRAADYQVWPLTTQLAFVFACGMVILSLSTLGKSFAIFPASRSLVGRGPYRIIRHPAYAGELAMMLVAATMRLDWINGLLVTLAVAFTALRIVVEEQFLRHHMDGYQQYTQTVQTRLVPWVW